MSTINLFRSMTDDRYETRHVEGGKPVKETIEADFTNAVISVNGQEQDENYVLQDGDLCTIRLFAGGDARDWFSGAGIGALIGGLFGALIAAATGPFGWAAFALGLGWGAVGVGAGIGTLAGALGFGIASAAGASMWGVIDSQQPDMKSPDALAKIPQLRGAKNQSNYNKPIPIVLGKHLYTPMYIGTPYTEIGGEDGEDQYFNALFLLGYGKLQVTDIQLGALGKLCSNKGADARDDDFLIIDSDSPYRDKNNPGNNPRLELRQGASEVSLYPQKVFEEQLSVELTNIPVDGQDNQIVKVRRFTAKNPMKVQVEFTFGGGLVAYNDEMEKVDASVSIAIQWKKPQEIEAFWRPFAKIGIKPDGINYEAGIDYSNGTSTITRRKVKMMRFIAECSFSYDTVKIAQERTIELRIQRASEQDIGLYPSR